MQRTIITHVGASLLSNECKVFKGFHSHENLLADLRGEGEFTTYILREYLDEAAKYLAKKLAKAWGEPKERRYRESPAEIASLSRLNLTPHDRVLLLHSDTCEGEFCARVLQLALSTAFDPRHDYPHCNSDQVVVEKVVGLRVTDQAGAKPGDTDATAELFVREGRKNYVALVWAAYEQLVARVQLSQGALIFNVTAGYKAMIPIARDLALLLPEHIRGGVEKKITTDVCCLYEESTRLIHYASLPIQFEWFSVNMTQLERAAAEDDPASAEGETTARERVSHDCIDPENQRYFTRIRDGETYMRLSPFGRVVWELGKKLDYGSINATPSG